MLTLTMFSVLTRCLGFLYKIYLAKIMSTTELGIYNITLSIYMVLITIVGSSIPLTISKITSSNKILSKEKNTYYSVTSSLILTSILSILLCLLILISKPLLTLIIGGVLGYNIVITLLPSIIFTAIYSQIRGYLWGIENYFAVSIVEFVEQILRILFCIILISLQIFKSPVLAVGTALSIACGISTLYGILLYFKNGGKFKYKNGYYKEIIKSSIPLTLVRLFGSILQPIIAVILPLELARFGISKNIALSELGIVMGMTMPLLSIPSTIIGALCMILIPKISSSDKKTSELKNQINMYIKFTITCVFIFIPIFIALGEHICLFVFDNVYAGLYLKLSSWIMLPLGLSQITTSILNAMNQEQKTFIYYVISSIFLIISMFILPKFFGIKAMLYGTGISTSILAILNIIKIRKLTNYNIKISKSLISHTLVSIPIILLNIQLFHFLDRFLSTFISFMICGVISVIFYFLLLIIFNIVEINNMKSYLSRYSKKTT